VKVQAISEANQSLSAFSAVTLENPVPVPQSVSPTLLPVGNFSLTVGGSGFVKGSKVVFGGTALPTTFVSPDELTASGTSVAAQTGNVKVTVQNPDPGAVASTASLTVQVGAAGHSKVTVSPATAQIHAGDTFPFKAALSGTL
jgi:hypothetical protein